MYLPNDFPIHSGGGSLFPFTTQPGTTILFNIKQKFKSSYVLSLTAYINILFLFVSLALLNPWGMSGKNSLFPIL